MEWMRVRETEMSEGVVFNFSLPDVSNVYVSSWSLFLIHSLSKNFLILCTRERGQIHYSLPEKPSSSKL